MIRMLAPIAVLLGTLVAANTAQADRGHHGGRHVVTRDHRDNGRTYYRTDYRPSHRRDHGYRHDRRGYHRPRYSYYRPRYAPPAIRVEVVRPRRGYFWVGGRYDWRDNNYVWAPGYYQAVQPGRVWVDGRWDLQADGYVWIDGYWQDSQQQQVWVDGRYEWQNGIQVWIPGYWAAAAY
jgi:hypothetical protein